MKNSKGFIPLEISRFKADEAVYSARRFLMGFSLLELVVVIAILGILLGAAVVRTFSSSLENHYSQGVNLVQSALIEAREMARSPKPSGLIDDEIDVYGYGVLFKLRYQDYPPYGAQSNTREFSVFKDVVDETDPENQGKWVDPSTTSIDDEIIKTYKFDDYKIWQDYRITQVWFASVEQPDGFSSDSINKDFSIVFKYSEEALSDVSCSPYLLGSGTLGNCRLSLGVIRNYEEREINIYTKSGVIEIDENP